MAAMSLFGKALWGLVGLSLIVAASVGSARMGWERAYRDVVLAVHGGDLMALNASSIWEALEGANLQAVTLAPQDVRELRRRYFPFRASEARLSMADLERLRARGFSVYWRLDAWISPSDGEAYVEDLLAVGPRGLLLAHPRALPSGRAEPIVKALQDRTERTAIGLVEFVDALLARRLYDHGVRDLFRAHLLKGAERAALDDAEAWNRLLQAVRERNVRFVELRALSLDQLISDATMLGRELERFGYALTTSIPPRPAPFGPGSWVLALMGLGWVSLLLLAIGRSMAARPWREMTIWTVGVITGLGALAQWPEFAPQGLAWAIAAGSPVAAYLLVATPRLGNGRDRHGIAVLLGCSAVSALGGLWAAAVLSSDRYFLGVETFSGVKAVLVLPVLGVGILAMRCVRWRAFGRFDALVGAAVGVALLVAVLRSGNVSPVPVLDFEVQVRHWLEGVFGVRPRFKEFLIGHPALVLWGSLGARSRRPWTVGLLLVGLLGQVSIVNSFLHLHTPLGVTLLRTAHGLWLGAVLGGLLQLLAKRAFRISPAQPLD